MINVKQRDVISAYKILNRLNADILPLTISFKIFKLKKALQSQFDWQIEEERKIFEKFNVRQTESGLAPEDPNDTPVVIKQMEELGNADVDVDIDKISIPLVAEIRIAPNEFDVLEKFIEFRGD